MKIGIYVLATVLVVFSAAKPYKRTSEATFDVDYEYNYDRDTHYNLEYDGYFPVVDRDFDVYEVEYDVVVPQYEIVRETDIEIDYTLEAAINKTTEAKISTK